MSQSTEKSLGQALYEADTAISTMPGGGWHTMDRRRQAGYERMAQAVVAVAREQFAQACEEYWYVDGSATAKEFANLIRGMKP